MTENNDAPEGSYTIVLSWSGLFKSMEEEHAFTHGFEVGQIWTKMTAGYVEIEQPVHLENVEVLTRAAVAQGFDVVFSPSTDSCWTWMVMRKVRPARDNPHGLRIVE